ncbi:MAG TPA: cytochrome P450, partial [Trichocoleus sp.]
MQSDQNSVEQPSSLVLGNPFPWYAQMRRQAPVLFDPEQQCWMVFSYEDVKRVFSEWQTFSSKPPYPPQHAEMSESLLYSDPPRHQTLRSLVGKAFTARRVEELAPRITQITHELIDKVYEQASFDFIQDLAVPLPIIVIAEILGIPVEDRADFKRWSDGIALSLQPDPASLKAMSDYFQQLLAQRRQCAGADLISDLIAVHESGETLTAKELVDFCMVLLLAGNETTTNLLGNAVYCFSENPETWERLKQQPALLPLAIEEVLRYRPPVQGMERYTTVETQLAGQTIPPGQMVVAWIGSANRDETQFAHPDDFIIDRDPNPHLSFGNGIHFCL